MSVKVNIAGSKARKLVGSTVLLHPRDSCVTWGGAGSVASCELRVHGQTRVGAVRLWFRCSNACNPP